MSNSRRKTPICGWTTARSEKRWKRSESRKNRRRETNLLHAGQYLDIEDPRDPGSFGPKDGKQFLATEFIGQRDFEKCMRK